MESNDLDKLFRDAFEQAEETPNPNVWLGIEQQLASEKKVVPFYKKYRKQLALAAAILLFFGLGLRYFSYQKPAGPAETTEIMAKLEQEAPRVNKGKTIKENEHTEEEPLETGKENKMLAQYAPTLEHTRERNESKTTDLLPEVIIESPVEENSTEIAPQEALLASTDIELPELESNLVTVNSIDPMEQDLQVSYAGGTAKKEGKSSLVTRVLNGITKNILAKNIDIDQDREIEFINDEEGSISINILNSFAKK